jgi:hypothetical protein
MIEKNAKLVLLASMSHCISILLSSLQFHAFLTTAPVEVHSQLHGGCRRYAPLLVLDGQLDDPQSWFGYGGKEKSLCQKLKAVTANHSLTTI